MQYSFSILFTHKGIRKRLVQRSHVYASDKFRAHEEPSENNDCPKIR